MYIEQLDLENLRTFAGVAGKPLNRSTQQGKQSRDFARPAPSSNPRWENRLGKTTPRRGQDKSAQGNALGREREFPPTASPERAVHVKVLVMSPPFRPFRARRRVVPRFPGRCPGLDCFGPFGAKRNVIRSQRLIITFPVARSYLGCRSMRNFLAPAIQPVAPKPSLTDCQGAFSLESRRRSTRSVVYNDPCRAEVIAEECLKFMRTKSTRRGGT